MKEFEYTTMGANGDKHTWRFECKSIAAAVAEINAILGTGYRLIAITEVIEEPGAEGPN